MVGFDLSLEVVDGGLGEDECDLLLEEGDEDFEFRDLSSELLLKVSELFLFDTLSAHSEDFLDEGLDKKSTKSGALLAVACVLGIALVIAILIIIILAVILRRRLKQEKREKTIKKMNSFECRRKLNSKYVSIE